MRAETTGFMEEPGMKCLVTGAAGFIGSHLCERLLHDGHEVVGVDAFIPYYPREFKEANLQSLRTHARFQFHELDLRTASLESLLDGVDVVLHTAALARVPRSIQQPLETHAANVTGTLNLLKACVDAGVRRLVYSSSSSVYGDQPTLPLTEDMPANPLNPYACQKYMGEIYCRNFVQVYGLETVCLRYFNVYGPRQVMEGAYRLVIGISWDCASR